MVLEWNSTSLCSRLLFKLGLKEFSFTNIAKTDIHGRTLKERIAPANSAANCVAFAPSICAMLRPCTFMFLSVQFGLRFGIISKIIVLGSQGPCCGLFLVFHWHRSQFPCFLVTLFCRLLMNILLLYSNRLLAILCLVTGAPPTTTLSRLSSY